MATSVKGERCRPANFKEVESAEQAYHKNLGAKVRKLREELGIRQAEVARALGVRQSFIAMLENGQKVPVFRINQVLNFLGYEIDFLEKKLCAAGQPHGQRA